MPCSTTTSFVSVSGWPLAGVVAAPGVEMPPGAELPAGGVTAELVPGVAVRDVMLVAGVFVGVPEELLVPLADGVLDELLLTFAFWNTLA
jgi:hypothetical protein